jgi:putative FmdB family regulatory protein
MPLYEYRCQCCGTRFERLVRAAVDAQSILCPQCQSAAVERVLSLFARTGGATAGAPACDASFGGG